MQISKYQILTMLVAAILSSCADTIDVNQTTGAEGQITINNGQFDVRIVVQNEGEVIQDWGDGTLSFDFGGDVSGSFSASGALAQNQDDKAGVGAIITMIENSDLDRMEEAISLLAIKPTGNGKADVISFGNKFDAPVDTLREGQLYGIGQNGPLKGVFLKGVPIQDFWDGDKNLFDVADNGFVLDGGGLFIRLRDGAHLTGTFTASTEPQ